MLEQVMFKELLCGGVIMLTNPSEVNDLPIAERRSLPTCILRPKQFKRSNKAPNKTNTVQHQMRPKKTHKRRSNKYLIKTQRRPSPDISYYVITKNRKVWERNQISSKDKTKEKQAFQDSRI